MCNSTKLPIIIICKKISKGGAREATTSIAQYSFLVSFLLKKMGLRLKFLSVALLFFFLSLKLLSFV
jgi:hypothetical protein